MQLKARSESPGTSPMTCERFTIGYLTPNISDNVGAARWHGVIDAAQEQDLNLVCFPGSYWRDPGPRGEANLIYELISPQQLDALILGNIVQEHKVNRDEFKRFCERHLRVPLVSMRKMLAGVPYIPIDDYRGMCAVMVHLIAVHGLTRIAFLSGPEGHPYAQTRYQAYVDTLKAYRLPLRPELVTTPSGWNEASVQELLDERKLVPPDDFEAVVAVNDRKALDALRTFQRRGMQVPGDVAVVGFNDDADAQVANPPLTSVYLPFYEQGHPLLKMLRVILDGSALLPRVTLLPRLVVQQSCGCMASTVTQSAIEPPPRCHPDLKTALIMHRDDILDAIAGEVADSPHARRWAAQLLDAFGVTLSTGTDDGSRDGFLFTLNNVLQQMAVKGDDVAAWQGVVSVLWRWLSPYLSDDGRLSLLADKLWHQARVMIGETAERIRMEQTLQANRWGEALREVGAVLITTFDLEALMDVLALNLPRLKIPSAFLSLYEDPQAPTQWARLFLAYTQAGRIDLSAGPPRFPAPQLIPESMWPQRRVSFVVEPLYFREHQIGFVLFEVGPREGDVYDALRGSISSALEGALLSQERQSARQELELFNRQLEQMVQERTLELERAYKQLAQLDRNKLDFIDIAAHELRTPLTVLQGYTGILRTKPAIVADPFLSEIVNGVLNGTERLHQIVNSMLDVARIDGQGLDLHFVSANLDLIVEHVLNDFKVDLADRQLSIQVEGLVDLPHIEADGNLLHKVFDNLINNAIKYTPDGGRIVLAGRRVSDEDLGACIEITVCDTGIGIDPADQGLIFEKFYQTGKVALHSSSRTKFKGGGPGLGLAIARGIVLAHAGRIWVESERHDEVDCPGSCFHILLPLHVKPSSV